MKVIKKNVKVEKNSNAKYNGYAKNIRIEY